MLNFYYTSLRTLLEHPSSHKDKTINIHDSEWEMYQLFHQLDISINNAKVIKDSYSQKRDCFSKEKPTLKECDIFIDVVYVFYHYLVENEDQLKSSPLKALSMISTTIFVEDNNVVLVTGDSNLILRMKKVCEEKKYKFDGKKVETKKTAEEIK